MDSYWRLTYNKLATEDWEYKGTAITSNDEYLAKAILKPSIFPLYFSSVRYEDPHGSAEVELAFHHGLLAPFTFGES